MHTRTCTHTHIHKHTRTHRHTHALADTFSSDAYFTGQCNAFTRAAREIFPGLAAVMDTAAAATRCPPRLSGAGPAFFILPSGQARHNAIADALRNTGAKAYLVHTVNPSDNARPAAKPPPSP